MILPLKIIFWKMTSMACYPFLPLWVDISNRLPFLKKPFKKAFYNAVAREVSFESGPFRLMNYGYAYITPEHFPISLDSSDKEEFEFSWQLVYETVKNGRLENKDVLVIGCGRGGDAYFVKRYMKAKKVTAIDFSERAIEICKKNYHLDELTFETGDAEALSFQREQFDAVVNIESSHCYPSLRKFYHEVRRVLKPGGIFLYADYFWDKQQEQYLEEAGFKILEQKDITQNVILAAEEGYELRKELIKKAAPEYFFNEMLEWSGTKGTQMYRRFKKKELLYKCFVLTPDGQKNKKEGF